MNILEKQEEAIQASFSIIAIKLDEENELLRKCLADIMKSEEKALCHSGISNYEVIDAWRLANDCLEKLGGGE